MTGPTYPAPGPTVNADAVTIHQFMKSPTSIARRVRTLLQQRYIADALLKQRLIAQGGAVLYDTGESLFTGEDAEIVNPGSEYPIITMNGGTLSLAKVDKWGQDSIVTDEAIARQLRNPVDKALSRLANQNVKTVDGVAMSVISSAVTQTQAAAGVWSAATADAMLKDIKLADNKVKALNEGYVTDTVVLDDLNWTYAFLAFVKAGYLPKESVANNPVLTGQFPSIDGKVWLTSPNALAGTVMVLDSNELGGMADEDLGGPGYVSAAGPSTAPVQVKSIREDVEDRYRVRARRVCVPVVTDPGAACKVTGVSA